MGERTYRLAPGPALLWVTGLLLLGLGLSTIRPATDVPEGDGLAVARDGTLEEAWEVQFHLAWPDHGQARAWLTAALPAPRVQRLQPGHETVLRLRDGEGEQEVLAKVSEITAPVDGVAHVVFTTAETYGLQRLPDLVPGRIVVRAGPFGTIVPVTALHHDHDGTGEGVYVERTAGPAWVPVRVLARSLTEAVVEGIAPGTRLAAEPAAAVPAR
jgi:multidrug efflux pump subunit AcrA (membrane-fusion protein)